MQDPSGAFDQRMRSTPNASAPWRRARLVGNDDLRLLVDSFERSWARSSTAEYSALNRGDVGATPTGPISKTSFAPVAEQRGIQLLTGSTRVRLLAGATCPRGRAARRLPCKQETPVRLRARASDDQRPLVAEQRGAGLLNRITQVRLLARGSGPVPLWSKSLVFHTSKPGASPGRVSVSSETRTRSRVNDARARAGLRMTRRCTP